MMNLPAAIITAGGLIAIGIFMAAPRYELMPIPNSTNAAAWKLNRLTGDVYLCATPAGENTEAGCSAKLKQF